MIEGAVVRSYKSGSIIYFEGDKGDDVYVLQQGAIRLLYSSPDGREEIHENVKRGEFFGVKSSLGRFPREETAQVLTDSVVVVFPSRAFEQLCLKNVRLVLQMLKVFSFQLRKVHRQVREQLGEIEDMEQSAELLRVGEHYFKHDRREEASYALGKFLEDYPDSTLYQRGVEMKQILDSGASYPENMESLEDTSGVHLSSKPQMPAADSQENTSSEAKNMEEEAGDASALYYEALNLISQEQLDEAISKFNSILDMKSFKKQQDAEFIEKSRLGMAKVKLKKGDMVGAVENASDFIRRHPDSDDIKKGMLVLAEALEKQNIKNKAMALYMKVANMQPKDQDSILANKKLDKLKE